MSEIILTRKDFEIIKLYCEGMIVKEISTQLQIPKRTIEDRLQRLRKELNCRTIAHLINKFNHSVIILRETA